MGIGIVITIHPYKYKTNPATISHVSHRLNIGLYLEGPEIRFIKKVRQLETKNYWMSQSESSGRQKVITLDNLPQNIKEIRLFLY